MPRIVANSLPRQYDDAPYNPSGPYHAEALAWGAAATMNNGIVSTSVMAAVSKFCDAIDAANLRDKFLRLNLMAGGNIWAAATPLYRGYSAGGTQYGNTVDVNEGPIPNNSRFGYLPTKGVNGYYGYLDPGLTMANLGASGMTPLDCHMSAWLTKPDVDQAYSEVYCGASDYNYVSNGGGLSLYVQYGSGSETFTPGEAEGDYAVYGPTQTPFEEGLRLGTCYGTSPSTDKNFIRNGVDVTNARSMYSNYGGLTATDVSLYILAMYDPSWGGYDFETNTGTPGFASSNGTMAAYSIGKGLSTQTQWTNMYNAFRDFMRAIGRAG